MALVHIVRFSDGRELGWMTGSARIYYLYLDGRILQLECTVGWCESCGELGPSECLPEEETLLADLKKYTEGPPRGWDPPQDYLRARLTLARDRRAPPVCLTCFSFGVSPLKWGSQPHPATGEEIELTIGGPCDTFEEVPYWFFTPEGEKLEVHEKDLEKHVRRIREDRRSFTCVGPLKTKAVKKKVVKKKVAKKKVAKKKATKKKATKKKAAKKKR